MLKQLSQECRNIVSSKPAGNLSLLRKCGANDIRSLSMNKICMELKMKTPLLYSVLMTIAIPAGKCKKPIDWTPSVAVAAAILLKQRNKLVNSVQIVLLMLIKYNGFHVCITIIVQ